MIDEIFAVLTEAGLLTGYRRPPVNIEITRGDAVVAYVFLGPDRFVHVKASELTPLAPAYRAHEVAWRSLPGFVPQPLGFFSRNGWDLALTEGVDAIPVHSDHLRRSRSIRNEDLLGVLTGMAPNPDLPQEYADPRSLLEALREHFGDRPEANVAELWLTAAAVDELRALPIRPQHGDFVPNNLGLCDRGLVVFDWEDYGVVNLAGFDLCTLIAAGLNFRAPDLANVISGPVRARDDWWSPLIDGYCRGVGIEATTFRRMIPLHLAIFLFLKRRYGSQVKKAVGSALQELIRTDI